MHEPQLDHEARVSDASVAPTLITSFNLPGDIRQASPSLLPPATTYVTPERIERSTAVSRIGAAAAPRLRFAIAGDLWFAVTQSTPARIVESVEVPLHGKTRTDQMEIGR